MKLSESNSRVREFFQGTGLLVGAGKYVKLDEKTFDSKTKRITVQLVVELTDLQMESEFPTMLDVKALITAKPL